MKAISNFRFFAAVLSLLAVALPAVNGQAVAVGTLLAAMGIAVIDPTCSSSWDWLVPYASGTDACGCRQSYVIVQSHNKAEDRTGPKMVYDHSEFFMSNEFKGNPPANFAFGALCQTSKSAVVPPMGTGGAEVGNAEGTCCIKERSWFFRLNSNYLYAVAAGEEEFAFSDFLTTHRSSSSV
jgi:hypothetical protein